MVFKKKCPACASKIDKKYRFCPYCGVSFKQHRDEEDFGMIGKDDFMDFSSMEEEVRLPMGLDKMMNSLLKQLEKQMNNLDENSAAGFPKGFKIQISTGKPQIKQVQDIQKKEGVVEVDEKEKERRRALPRKEAESNVRRLSDKIVYEISVPGVKSKKDVAITKLENSIEIKAYSKDNCYYKAIPLKVDLIGYQVVDNKLLLELKD